MKLSGEVVMNRFMSFVLGAKPEVEVKYYFEGKYEYVLEKSDINNGKVRDLSAANLDEIETIEDQDLFAC